jgi:REP element-mobilizing transposase RayT
MHLSAAGEIVRDEWFRASVVRPEVSLMEDEFVVMPDHLHGILWLDGPSTTDAPEASHPLVPAVLGTVIGQFKSLATKRINGALSTPGLRRWQRGFYDHVIRSEVDLLRIQQYVRDNPLRWGTDRESRVHDRTPRW